MKGKDVIFGKVDGVKQKNAQKMMHVKEFPSFYLYRKKAGGGLLDVLTYVGSHETSVL